MSARSVILGDVVAPRVQKAMPSEHPSAVFVGLEHVQSHTGELLGTAPASSMKSSASVVYSGDVMYGRLRPYLNKVHLAESAYLASGEFIVFPPSSAMLPEFLLHLLRSPDFLAFTAILDTGDRPRVNWNGIKNFPFVLPPLNVQQRIVETLEDHLSRLDKALAEVDSAESLLQVERRALLRDALNGALTDGSGAMSMTDAPPLWSSRVLGDVVEIRGGYMFSSRDWKDTGVPVIKIGNVRNRRVNLRNCGYVDDQVAQESMKAQVSRGDLLITLTGEIGAIGFYTGTDSARLNQRLGIVSSKNTEILRLDFLSYWLESPNVRAAMWSVSKGAAQANISTKDILGLTIVFPSIEEQQGIVARLEDHLSRLDATARTLTAVRTSAQTLRRSLLHAAFTGQLTNEDSND